MMDVLDYVLVKLAEEADELALEAVALAKMVSKCLRFGVHSAHPQGGETNLEAIGRLAKAIEIERQDLIGILLVLERFVNEEAERNPNFPLPATPLVTELDEDRYLALALDSFARYTKSSVRAGRLSKWTGTVIERLTHYPIVSNHVDPRTRLRIDVTGSSRSGKSTVAMALVHALHTLLPGVAVHFSTTSQHMDFSMAADPDTLEQIAKRLVEVDVVDHDAPLRVVRPVRERVQVHPYLGEIAAPDTVAAND